MVTLSRIYTRTGDDGTTALGDMTRIAKTDPRLIAFADVDEANAALGEVVAGGAREHLTESTVALLIRVQNDLFDVGADLCTPLRPEVAHPQLRITEAYVTDLESAIDAHNAELPPLRSFVLPGGTMTAARLHTARTVTRRAERSTWLAIEQYGTEPVAESDGEGGVSVLTAHYLNRLSDLLFVLSRVANAGQDVLWTPGGGRAEPPSGDVDPSPGRS